VLTRKSNGEQGENAKFKVAGTTHSLRDATVILLESPILRFVASTGGPQAAIWVESGLPLGMVDWIEGRTTQSVYLEFSGADWFSYIGKTEIPRAVWIVRAGLDYGVRLYSQRGAEFHQISARFSFDGQQGKFILSAPISGPENEGSQNTRARDALFAGLAILRDLSPGLKPTITHIAIMDDRPVPGRLLTDQRARATLDRSRRYLRPSALDGGSYFLSPHDDPMSELDIEQGFAWYIALKQFLPSIKEQSYATAACRLVAEAHARRDEYLECVEVIEQVRARSGDGDWTPERTAEWNPDLAKLLSVAYMNLAGREAASVPGTN
jgi:hypothetical protein